MQKRILRLPEVKNRTGLSRSTIYSFVAKGIFPRNLSLGPRSVGWLESDIQQWIEERVSGGAGNGKQRGKSI